MKRLIVSSGAATQNLSHRNITEARVVADYITQKLGQKAEEIKFRLDLSAYNSLDNIHNSHLIIESWLGEEFNFNNTEFIIICGYGVELTPGLRKYLDEIVKYLNESEITPGVTIWCKSSRKIKVLIMAWWFLHRRVKMRTVSWEKSHLIFQTFSTVGEIVALFIPGLATWGHHKSFKHAQTR